MGLSALAAMVVPRQGSPMSDQHPSKPTPARPGGSKPIPARGLEDDGPSAVVESDVSDVYVEVAGQRWTVRVLGRSGRTSVGAAPLLLIGFWNAQDEDAEPLEALVAARALEGLSEEQLESALLTASKPPDPARKRSFFPDAGQIRRR